MLNPGSPASISLRVCLRFCVIPVRGFMVGEGVPELSNPEDRAGDDPLLFDKDFKPSNTVRKKKF